MIGRPVTDATESAAPPRASPSSLVRTTAVKSTPSWKALAVATASWPIMASITKKTSSGSIALRMSEACFIRSASTPRRPAVSTITMSYCLSRANLTPSRATFTGLAAPPKNDFGAASSAPTLPGSGA